MATFSPCIQFPVNYSIIQPTVYMHVEPQPFALMAQGSIYTTESCDPDTMTLDKTMAQYDREEFIKAMKK